MIRDKVSPMIVNDMHRKSIINKEHEHDDDDVNDPFEIDGYYGYD